MLRRTVERLLISGVTLGALAAAGIPASGSDPTNRAFQSASPVQAYGSAVPTPASGPTPANAIGAPSIQLLNDPSSGGEVWFLIDGQERSLKPGETLDLPAGPSHLVEYNTGGQAGDAKFTLYQGLYKFKVGSEGWGLFKSSAQPSVAGNHAGGMIQDRRGFHPPLPAEDLRTRKVARGTNGVEGHRFVDPQAKPADSTGNRDATHSISAPPPPAPGVIRERARPSSTP
ncbi:MAG: hypothetical protein K1X57_21655 [Gemmataceae bacterium]|nr:hypothetical protein [Gemmataceae bacterium]